MPKQCRIPSSATNEDKPVLLFFDSSSAQKRQTRRCIRAARGRFPARGGRSGPLESDVGPAN